MPNDTDNVTTFDETTIDKFSKDKYMSTTLYQSDFSKRVQGALKDENLQKTLSTVKDGFILKRRKAADKVPEFEQLRDQARDIKTHTIDNLDQYLEAYEKQVIASGGHVHWARTIEEAQDIVIKICREVDAKIVTKGKSMISEEIHLNERLEREGMTPVETDLGEYIIQLRKEAPSHIIAPAIHVTRDQIEDDFRDHHIHLDPKRDISDAPSLLAEARQILRDKYFEAEVGITGANFLIAETGSSVIVTNEGNGDLTQTLAKTHIVLASLEKIVPTLNDCMSILRVLARSATGQETSVYTTFSTGPKRSNDLDGPENYHVVLLDNGRSSMIGSSTQEMLHCIRCGACINHCPVYHQIGGHAYGTTYPGPMGSVLSPGVVGLDATKHMPNASTFCGRCEAVCPMRIPLPKMMRHWREEEFKQGKQGVRAGLALKVWAFFAKRPKLYQSITALAVKMLALLPKNKRFKSLPLAGGWISHRDLPAPQGQTFMKSYREKRQGGEND